MRVQIWIALLEIASLLLVIPHLSSETRLVRMQSILGAASNWLMDSWRIDFETADVGRWVRFGIFMIAVSWLILATQLRVRWFLIVPAMIIVLVPVAMMAGKYLAGVTAQRRYAHFLYGAGCFLAAKLIAIASALSRS